MSRWNIRSRSPVRLPQVVGRLFETHLKERYPRARPHVVQAVVEELSELFTAERDRLPPSYLSRPPVRSAYLAYFHPLQALRGLAALEEVIARARARDLWPDLARPGARVVDLGTGLGAMAQALLMRHARADPDRWPEIVLVDHQRAALKDARELTELVAAALAPRLDPPVIRTAAVRVEDWIRRERGGTRRADVVLTGGLWNEWDGDWQRTMERLLQVVDPRGVVVVVEPAIPDVARRLMSLRDAFLDSTTTVAPCTHGAACPLARLRKDWCFTVRRASVPESVARLARKMGHQTADVRFALWAFTPRPDAAPFEHPPREHARVVTDRLDGQRVLCLDGRRERIPDPDASALRGSLATRS